MKQSICTFLLLISFFTLNGEDLSYTPKDYSILPPSPEVSKLIEINDIQVNYYTGSPDISFTLFSIETGDVQLPITVSYNSGGIQTNAKPNNLGLGWNLQASAVIGRSVIGAPDEAVRTSGLRGLFNAPLDDKRFRDSCIIRKEIPLEGNYGAFNEEFKDIAYLGERHYKGLSDMGNDIARLSGLGLKATIIFDENKKIHTSSNPPVKITYTSSPYSSGFVVENNHGIIYRFNKFEESTFGYKYGNPLIEQTVDSLLYISSWHLTSIKGLSPDPISLSYVPGEKRLVAGSSSNVISAYSYDKAKRLTTAYGTDVFEAFLYDLNTNVTYISRKYQGETAAATSINMDGNKVSEIYESAEDELLGIVPKLPHGIYTSPFSYDNNGRVIKDETRAISEITYQPYGNFPRRVNFEQKVDENGKKLAQEYILYTYRPDGTNTAHISNRHYIQLRPTIDSNGDTISVSKRVVGMQHAKRYYGAFENNEGSWLYHTPAGYIKISDGSHHYFAKDYLGSTRVVYTSNISQITPFAQNSATSTTSSDIVLKNYIVEQQTRYFASGLPIEVNGSATDRLHIGNVWLNDMGYGRYNNNARQYDALLCRFDTPDALASKYTPYSPYCHTGGNPVNNIDFSGNDWF